jgi:hypothetical protein
MIVGSPRQALAYMFACRTGPGMVQQHPGRLPRDTGRHHLDHVLLGALLYGPRITGCCGVTPGSHLDLELRTWATERGTERSDQVRAIERRMRTLLRLHGMMHQPTRFRAQRFDCGDGSPQLRALGFEAIGEKTVARVAKFCSDSRNLG